MPSPIVVLPTTPTAFDALVDRLAKRYKFENKEHVAAIVANKIQTLPPDQATCTLEYLGHCVMKSMAYLVAREKSQEINHRAQIEVIEAALKANPNNQEALDALEKAANDGSDLAKSVLEEYRATQPPLTMFKTPLEPNAG